MSDVVKMEVLKLLEAWIIYPISDSKWVSPVHVVPKKGGVTVVKNDKGEVVENCVETGWRMCIDYRKLNKATRKDHFPLPFIDQMLERLTSVLISVFWMFTQDFSKFQFTLMTKRRPHSHVPMAHSPIEECRSDYVTLLEHFNDA